MGPTCCRIGHAQSPDLRLYEATKPGCSFLFIMAALHSRCGHYIFILWFLLYYFFSSPNLKRSEIGCLPYFHTWCGLSANFRCRSETCCTGLAANTGRKKSPSGHHRTTSSGYIFATKARIDNRKKIVKQQYLLHMFPQYGELGPVAAEMSPVVWGTPANFNGFGVLAALLHGTPVLGVSQTLRR